MAHLVWDWNGTLLNDLGLVVASTKVFHVAYGDGLTRCTLAADALGALASWTGTRSKAPHLAAHLNALELVGRDCVLIGDPVDDADAAASVGARCVLYTGGLTDPERLRASGWPVVDTLADAVSLAV